MAGDQASGLEGFCGLRVERMREKRKGNLRSSFRVCPVLPRQKCPGTEVSFA